VELTSLPMAASAGGFVYALSPTLGVPERASDDFGPFVTERALHNGRGQAEFGVSVQGSSFGALQGASLSDGTFPANAARRAGTTAPFSIDRLALTIDSRTTTLSGSYGVTDRWTVGVHVPISTVRFTGRRVRFAEGQEWPQATQAGSATGLGDIAVTARGTLAGDGSSGVAVGADLALPTGRRADLLGAGRASLRLVGIGSWARSRAALHVNGVAGVGGLTRELSWSTAATYAASRRVTLAGEVLGRYLGDLHALRDVYVADAAGIETMRWLPTAGGIRTVYVVAGAKWNVAGSWLLNTSLLARATDSGLTGRVTPAISFDYAFDR
jgi:hypothetical protein